MYQHKCDDEIFRSTYFLNQEIKSYVYAMFFFEMFKVSKININISNNDTCICSTYGRY